MALVTYDTNDAREGGVFTGRPKKVSWERLWAYSGGPYKAERWLVKNIHTDLQFATACGLTSKVAALATQFQQDYIVQLMVDLFGVDWLSHGTVDVKFINIVNVGDTLAAEALIQSKETKDNATKFTIAVDCGNQIGEKVLVCMDQQKSKMIRMSKE